MAKKTKQILAKSAKTEPRKNQQTGMEKGRYTGATKERSPTFKTALDAVAKLPAAGNQSIKSGGPKTTPGKKQSKKRNSKQDRLIKMLKRPDGATVAQIMKATGWQQHSVRGFLSGTIKKKLGLAVTSVSEDRGRVYRITNGAGS